jgi:O-antigen ligase
MILKLLVICSLLLFPFGELLRIDLKNHVTLKPLDIVVGITAVWWIIINIHNYKSTVKIFKKNYFLFPLVSFISVGFISLLINLTWLTSSQFFVSLLYLLRFISYALLVPIVSQFDKTFKKKIMYLLFFDGVLLLLFGFIQYFFYNSLKNLYYLGWDEHMHRVFSTFLDPNFAGAFFVLFFLFLAGAVYKHITKKEKKQAIIIGSILVVTLLAIFLTFSRSALLMLIVGAITFFFLIKRKKLVLFVLGALLLFGVIISPYFGDENMNLFRMNSTQARISNNLIAVEIIQQQPLLGVGFNAYRYAKQASGVAYDWTHLSSHADAGVDNSWLFVLATTGVVGFTLYLWVWGRILKRAFVANRKTIQIGAVVVIASSFAMFTNALFINSLFFAPLMLWMWSLIGLQDEF